MSSHDDIIQRLSRIEAKLEGLEKIPCLKAGNGSNPLVRIDRLERAEGERRWTLRALITAVLALVVKLVHELVTG